MTASWPMICVNAFSTFERFYYFCCCLIYVKIQATWKVILRCAHVHTVKIHITYCLISIHENSLNVILASGNMWGDLFHQIIRHDIHISICVTSGPGGSLLVLGPVVPGTLVVLGPEERCPSGPGGPLVLLYTGTDDHQVYLSFRPTPSMNQTDWQISHCYR